MWCLFAGEVEKARTEDKAEPRLKVSQVYLVFNTKVMKKKFELNLELDMNRREEGKMFFLNS